MRPFLFSLLVLFALSVKATEQPNFIIYITDDVSWNDLGSNDDPISNPRALGLICM